MPGGNDLVLPFAACRLLGLGSPVGELLDSCLLLPESGGSLTSIGSNYVVEMVLLRKKLGSLILVRTPLD